MHPATLTHLASPKLKCTGLKELYYSFPSDNKLTPVNHLGLLVMQPNDPKHFVLLVCPFQVQCIHFYLE